MVLVRPAVGARCRLAPALPPRPHRRRRAPVLTSSQTSAPPPVIMGRVPMAAVGTVRGALPAVALPPDRHPAVPARLDNTGVMVHAYPVVLIALRVVVAEVWVHRRSAHAASGCGANQALRHTATLGPIRHRASQTRRISPVVRLVSTCALELVFPQPLPAARPPGQAIRRAAPVRVKRGVRRAMAVPAGASLVLVRAARPVARARQVSTGAMAIVFQAIVP